MTSDMENRVQRAGHPQYIRARGRNLVFLHRRRRAGVRRKGIRQSGDGRLRNRFFRLSRLPRRHTLQGHAGRPQPRHGRPFRRAYPPDVAGQGPHMDPRRAGRRRAFCGVCPYRDAHPAISGIAASCTVGLRLRPVPACKLREHGWKEYLEWEMSESGEGKGTLLKKGCRLPLPFPPKTFVTKAGRTQRPCLSIKIGGAT